MGWGSNVFPLLIITSSGGFTGLFEYSPAPAKGNLILSSTASNGTDPFGNAFYKGLVTYAPSSGSSFVVNLLSTANSAFFQYAAPSGGVQGSLILAVSSAAGTDPVTAAHYPAGLYGVDPAFGDTFTGVGASINFGQIAYTTQSLFAALAGSSTVAPLVVLDAPEQTAAHHAEVQVTGTSADGATQLSQVLMGITAGGTHLTRATNVLLEVQGTTGLKNATAPASVAGYAEPFASSGHLDYVAGVAGDTNTYQTGRLTLITNSTTLINNTTPITITGLSFNVSIGTYRVSGLIRLTAAASGVVQPFTIRVNGTATVSTMLIELVQWNAEGTPTATLGVLTALNADPNHLIGTLGNSNVYTAVVDGTVTFSAAGTFFFTARAVTLSTDETATAQTGNYIDLMPVV